MVEAIVQTSQGESVYESSKQEYWYPHIGNGLINLEPLTLNKHSKSVVKGWIVKSIKILQNDVVERDW